MKRFLSFVGILIFLLAQSSASAQTIEILEGDTLFLCEPGVVPLHAIFTGIDSSNLQSSIPLQTIDDTHSGVIDIGFPFTFYGNTYTQCVLSTNNYITFDLNQADTFSNWTIYNPLPDPNYPADNAIFGPWHDTYPGAWGAPQPGWISYTTMGDAPNRVFIYNMCMIPLYSCVDSIYSGQIKLFEGSNNIEFHITYKTVCQSWNEGQAIMGLQNANGTIAEVVNGYDANVQWYAQNVAWKLTPNGNSDYDVQSIPYDPVQVYASNQLQWYGNGLFSPVYSDTVALNITESGWAYVTFFGCFGTTLSQAGSDSIYIAVNYSDFTQSQRNSACDSASHNALFINFPSNVNGPYDLTWTDSSGNVLQADTNVLDIDSLTHVPAGLYHLIVTNAVGCTFDYDYTIPKNTIKADFSWSPSLICQHSDVSFTNLSTGSLTSFEWWFGDTDVGYETNPVHDYHITGDSIRVILFARNDTFDGCLATDTAFLQIHPNIVAKFDYDSPRCDGRVIDFWDRSFLHPVSWQWYDGDSLVSTAREMQLKKDVGAYAVTLIVTDSLCGTDTLTDYYNVLPYPVVDIGMDTLLCPGESIELDAGNPGMQYLWSTGETTQTITLAPSVTTIVHVDVSNMGCEVDDERLLEMNCSLIFPNAFSPNGDGRNDEYMPHLVNMASYEFFIYNRWGQMLFESTGSGDATNGWDGTHQGTPQPVGVYVYYAQGVDIKGQPVKTMGNFTLLR